MSEVIKLSETTRRVCVSHRYPVGEPIPDFDELRGLFLKKLHSHSPTSGSIHFVEAFGLHRYPADTNIAQTHWQIDMEGWLDE